MSTALVVPKEVVTLQPKEYHYTPEQIALISRTVAPGLTQDEFQLFLYVARIRNLDPLQRQIHAVKRKSWDTDSGAYIERMTLQTGIDGYRAIANRTGLYMPSDKLPLIENAGKADMRITVWLKKFSPRDSQWHEYGATAYYKEFVQTYKKNNAVQPNSMWEKMPVNQLTKCAEALALRKGWPEELGGIYADEEMGHQGDVIPPATAPKQDKTQREMGTLKPSTEPNRGHGNEGMKQETVICSDCGKTNSHEPTCKYAQAPCTECHAPAGKPHATKCSQNGTQKVDSSPVQGQTEPTPTQTTPDLKPGQEKMLLIVLSTEEWAKGGKEKLNVTVEDNEMNEWTLGCWDKKLWDALKGATGQKCVFVTEKVEKNGRAYYTLVDILAIGATEFTK